VAASLPRFLSSYPTWQKLATASLRDLQDVIRPFGLWHRRAQVLKSLSRAVVDMREGFPIRYQELTELPGVGQYVANAILLFYHNKRVPLIDGSVARFLGRYFGHERFSDLRYDKRLQQLGRRLVQVQDPQILNWAILDQASLVCKPIPRCDKCVLRRACAYCVGERRDSK
jgi:A/G-specific adenine glycosylase